MKIENFFISCFYLIERCSVIAANGFPMVLIPGDAGSQVFAKLNKTTAPRRYCYKQTSEYFLLWLNIELLAPLILDCWVDNMMLVYDNVTRTTSNTEGVTIKIPEMGDTETVEYIDTSKVSVSLYFADLVNAAVGFWGYERNKSIRGVPYDFRKAPNEHAEFFTNFKRLIEQTYYANHNTKVIVVGHSMGNLMSLYFYNQQTKQWKDKFIRCHISIAAPWGGSAKIVRLIASGYNMDYYRILVSPITLRRQQRSMPSTAWLMPTDKLWPPEEPLIEVKENRTYGTHDYRDFFRDLNFQDGLDMHMDTKNLTYAMKAPGVEMHCIYGIGLPTPEKFIYGKKDFPDYQPIEIMGEGDGTVNARSNRMCEAWRSEQAEPVYTKLVENWEHLEILQNKEIIDYIGKIALSDPKSVKRRLMSKLQFIPRNLSDNVLPFVDRLERKGLN